MKRHISVVTGKLRLAGAIAALVATSALPMTAAGAERVVLCEEFMAIW